MTTAVVTTVHGRHEHLRRQQLSLARSCRLPELWIVVAMGDPAVERVLGDGEAAARTQVVNLSCTPDRLPLAAARNHGSEAALELGATTLIYLDVDCLVAPELTAGYERAVGREEATIWSGPVPYLPPGLDEQQLQTAWLWDDPHPGRPSPPPGQIIRDAEPELFWSLSFALSSAARRRTGGFHEEYVGYGAEDTDFALKASARGLSLAWLGDARAYHQHHPVQSELPERVDDILHNGRIFANRWGWWPMTGWLEQLERRGFVCRAEDGWQPTSKPQPDRSRTSR